MVADLVTANSANNLVKENRLSVLDFHLSGTSQIAKVQLTSLLVFSLCSPCFHYVHYVHYVHLCIFRNVEKVRAHGCQVGQIK